jgi:hypothetical protein
MNNSNTFNVLIAGCSFSVPEKTNWYSWTVLLENYLKKQLKDEYSLNILARSSAGQTKISDLVIEATLNDTNKYDLVLIQWSAFSRVFGKTEREALFNLYNHFIDIDDRYLVNLYGTEYTSGDFLDFVEDDIVKQSLLKIVLTQLLLQKKGIDYKMWFGWQQIYKEQINCNPNLSKILDEMESDKNLLFFKHKDAYDYELPNYLNCGKGTYQNALKKLFGHPTKDFYWPGSNYGGMTEYIRENLKNGKYVNKKNDQHPSSEGHKVFFEGVIKPILDEKIKVWKLEKNKS